MFNQLTKRNLFKSLLFSIVCIGLVIFSLVACGGTSENGSPHPTPTAVSTPSPTPTAVSTPSPTPTAVSTPSPTPLPAFAPFKVTSIDMAVSPLSVAGLSCGTSLTATYTATFHIAPNSPGGTIQFFYTWNNGRAETRASISIDAYQTIATYAYTWSGKLSQDHVYPGIGEVWTDTPNVVYSSQARPTGGCV